jgi:AraC-like DNA-binding protein
VPLLARHTVLETRSVATARDDTSMFRGFIDYQSTGPQNAFHLRIAAVGCEEMKFTYVSSSGHELTLIDDDQITLLAPRRGGLATDNGGFHLDAPAGCMIVPRRGRRRTRVGPEFEGLAVLFPANRLRQRAIANPADGRALAARLGDGGALAGPQAALLGETLSFLAGQFDAADTLATSGRALRSVAALLSDMLLDCFQAGTEPAAGKVPRMPGPAQVRRAEEAIRARLGEDFSVRALAAELGIGTRALELAFLRHRGITPREALAHSRLDAAHSRLRSAGPAETVTSIAMACGVTHLGRFAARYRERFGELPSDTLQHARRHQ